jgi:hypothetical protein
MPTKIQQLKAVVLEKIKEIENKDDSNTEWYVRDALFFTEWVISHSDWIL